MPTLDWYRTHKKELRRLRWLPLLWLGVALFYNLAIKWPVNILVLNKLSDEYARIVHPSQARLVEDNIYHGPTHVSVRGQYLAVLSYDDLAHCYDVEMAKNGWRLFEERRNAPGGPELNYCKGPYTATIYYYGETSLFDFTYEFMLKSGIISDCAMIKGGGIVYMSFSDTLFALTSSLALMLYCLLILHVSWTMSVEEFLELFRGFKLQGPMVVLVTRVQSAVWFAIGFVIALVSAYKLIMYIQNWVLGS